MSDTRAVNRGGIGFLGLLALVFITLKLTGYIDWPWWVVLLPIWGPLALLVIVILIGFAAFLFVCWRDLK